MDEILTNAEIEARFPGEWILVVDPVKDDSLEVLSGKVVCHSPDRDVVYRKMVELKPKHSAILCTIEMPENTEIVL